MVYALGVLVVVVLATRLTPLLFANRLQRSDTAARLSRELSPCILVLLIAHTLHTAPILSAPYGVPELGGLLATAGGHVAFRRILLSMALGVGTYVLLLQLMQ